MALPTDTVADLVAALRQAGYDRGGFVPILAFRRTVDLAWMLWTSGGQAGMTPMGA